MINGIWVFGAAYLAGSVNFAILFFKIAGRADPRLSFSGNAGTTNVYRLAGMPWAVLVFALDIGRAMAVAVLAGYFLDAERLTWAGFFLVLGNSFPCFHGFRGGKGVANYLGFTVLTVPVAALSAAWIWVLVYWLKRMPFIASFFMVAALSAGHVVSSGGNRLAAAGAAATFALIIFNHRKNIREHRRERHPTSPA
ncbi:MAG TPA: glycerol-3-phosphate acyltransferase [Smithellaceae bacterium]|nr:glycerol-3-phosphate acyltransferase [Smithellaceae bacterium]HRS82219.1 glycerol-3-phosphate acyltransferase [Smithellaceae bacterium]HRV46007.1 glycerol-3-phosphate acyltransferase [Smithellaceae bacterium]